MEMEAIKRKNRVYQAIWCAVLTAAGVWLGFLVYADSYLARYYDVSGYLVAELVQVALTVLWTCVCWHWATSENVKGQGRRMWISEHGTLATLLGFLPTWLVAVAGHIICSTTFSIGNSGYRIYTIFLLPILYMALSYLLPPVEIQESVLPGGGVGQKIARGVLVAALLAAAVGIWCYDFL